MGLFSNKYSSVNEFDDMRQALGKADNAADEGAVGAANGRIAAGDTRDGKPAEATETVAETPAKPGATTRPECMSIVSAGSSWQGTLKIDGSARIDGELNGEIEARDTVHISEGARVDAKVKAAVVIIAGTFQGQVQCSERLELMPLSHIQGELSTKALKIHEGAFIDGQIQMTGQPRRNGSETATPTKAKMSSPAVVVPPAADGLPAS